MDRSLETDGLPARSPPENVASMAALFRLREALPPAGDSASPR